MSSKLDALGSPRRHVGAALLLVGLSGLGFGCRQDMHDQARVDAWEEDPLHPGEAAARLPPAGVIARDELAADDLLERGEENGRLGERFPRPVTLADLRRGRERFDIFCAPCHGLLGRGDGPVAQRGFFPRVADLQEARLRFVAVGYLFGVVTNGFGAMPAYGPEIPVADRWALLAYLRALQLSQNPEADDLAEPPGAGGASHGRP
jgi:mono/diheme cytochrome c family protein